MCFMKDLYVLFKIRLFPLYNTLQQYIQYDTQLYNNSLVF